MPNSEESIKDELDDLCSKLNVDQNATVKSWESYQEISQNYTLDGDPLHWLSCALYVACRTSITPTIETGKAVEGNCVSLTRLLRLCNISLIHFFNKIKKWMDMTSMSTDFKLRIERLEHKFAVSTVLFQNYKPIFQEIFVGLTNEVPKSNSKGTKKQKLLPCTTNAVFEFTWCLYVCVKGEFHNSADDLVDMYHVLLSCFDYVFSNAFLARRTDLINPNFKGLPPDWNKEGYKMPSRAPCIIAKLCEMKEASSVEAATTKEYSWKPVIESFFRKGILKGDSQTLSGILDIGSFDVNLKALNNLYETYVLSVGDFDERIFLGEHANTDIGTPNKVSGEDISKAIATFGPNGRPHAPATPLTGRRYLRERAELLTPVSEATNSVARLRTYLVSSRPQPSSQLLMLFSDSGVTEDIVKTHVVEACKRWRELLSKSLLEQNCSNEIIELRTNMITCLHYKVLEHILREERRKKPQVSLQIWLTQEILQLTVYACCTEVVLHAYGAHSMRFPRILTIYGLSAFHFYKIIELVVQAIKDKLSRDVIKHLNAVEEQALESLVWRADSPLWAQLASSRVPPSADVYVHDSPQVVGVGLGPPHAAHAAHQRRITNCGLQSPVSACERFVAPGADHAKKQLFKDNIKPGQSLLVATNNGTAKQEPTTSSVVAESQNAPYTPKKMGKSDSLVLFFRKFYSLAVVRMNDLCFRLSLTDQELKRKIWTCLEHSVMHQTQLLKDRHLDQILMCTIYVICKVSNNPSNPVERTFAEIMRFYRQQPQADNYVYRSVFIGTQPDGSPERGDLIKFYNKVYVQCMQSFALCFTGRHKDECSLSPLPAGRGEAARSPPGQRVSERHHVYVKPLTTTPPSNNQLIYRFSRSPAKDLHAINTMLSCDLGMEAAAGVGSLIGPKRALESNGSGAMKRPRYGAPSVARKLHGLMTDRQAV